MKRSVFYQDTQDDVADFKTLTASEPVSVWHFETLAPSTRDALSRGPSISHFYRIIYRGVSALAFLAGILRLNHAWQ